MLNLFFFKSNFNGNQTYQGMIAVKNIARGKLIYKSKRTIGYQLEWQKKGDINYIEFSELMYLKKYRS